MLYFFPGVLTSNRRGGGWASSRIDQKMPLLGAIGCRCWAIAGCHWIGCHGKVPLLGAIARCHVVRCHGEVPSVAGPLDRVPW